MRSGTPAFSTPDLSERGGATGPSVPDSAAAPPARTDARQQTARSRADFLRFRAPAWLLPASSSAVCGSPRRAVQSVTGRLRRRAGAPALGTSSLAIEHDGLKDTPAEPSYHIPTELRCLLRVVA